MRVKNSSIGTSDSSRFSASACLRATSLTSHLELSPAHRLGRSGRFLPYVTPYRCNVHLAHGLVLFGNGQVSLYSPAVALDWCPRP